MNRNIFIAVTVLVLAFPIFFGGNQEWAWDSMAFLTALVLFGWSYYFFKENKELHFYSRLKWLAALYAVVIVWILFQALVPVPEAWINPVRLEAETALGATLPHVISLDPASSLTGLVRLLTYGIIFFLVIQTVNHREDAKLGLMAFAMASIGFAGYGLLVYFSGSETILGIDKEYYLGDLTSTFINRNSYATFAGFGLLAITAVSLQKWLDIKTAMGRGGRHPLLLTAGEFFSKYWWLILAWLIVITALFLTGSRAGTISSLFATIFLVGLYFVKRRISFLRGMFGLAALVILLGLIFTVSGDKITERISVFLAEEEISDARVQLYSQAADVIRDYPWTGTGYETYQYIFYFYRDFEGYVPLPAVHTHNTYLENMLELGIPVSLIFLSIFIVLFLTCYKGIKRRRSGFILPAFGVSLTVLISLHALVDFSMEMPGIAAAYAFLMGLAVTQCWPMAAQSRKSI